MKKLYFTLVLLSCSFFVLGQTTPTGNSEEVGITEGQLSVSLTGGANYVIPIAVPPGINGVVPQVSLAYNSQGGNGMAGYGWNISGVSAITRIPRTQFHDGVVGGVNLDANDRFALDGQRLIVKTGTTGVYGANGTIYETESFSNLKITSIGTHPSGVQYGPSYFKVEYPDGSIALYGNSTDSRSKAKWGITYWQNAQNVRISYTYIVANNNLNVEYIRYGNTGALAPINQIRFVYKPRQKTEQWYIAGESFLTDTLLSEIQVSGNNVGFRNYVLAHEAISLGYEFLKTVTEKSGDNTKAYNPTVFTYDNTTPTVINNTPYNLNLDIYLPNINYDRCGSVSGDFDGDGKLDVVVYSNSTSDPDPRDHFVLYRDIKDNATTNSITPNYVYGKPFIHIFTSTNVLGGTSSPKLAPNQFYTIVRKDATDNKKVSLNSRYFSTSNNSLDGIGQKNITFPDDVSRQYLDGDFNGDGITDVIAVENYSSTKTSFATYFIDLDARKTSNYSNYSGEINKGSIYDNRIKLSTGDFNGDGKTDIYYVISGFVKVYSLGVNNQLYLLYENTVHDNDIDWGPIKSVLFGDFNGDGKTDFMIAKDTNYSYPTTIWFRYISTGINFIKTSKDFQLEYVKDTGDYNGDGHNFNYIPTDYNNDGSTDIMVVRRTKGNGYYYFNTYSQYVSIQCFISKNDGFERINIYEGSSTDTSIPDNGIPIFLTSRHSKQSQQIALLKDDKIYPFPTLKDFSNERLLKTITTGNGVKETISYSPVFKDSCTTNCQSVVSSAEGIENYPNRDIANAPGFEVVSMLEKQSDAVYKKQLFKYHGAVSNMEGLGFLGFRATMRTNWHDNSNSTPIISTITKTDVNLRGAATESFSVLGLIEPSKILAPTDSFISRNINTYNMVNGIFENPLQTNKVYKLKLTQSKQINGLDNTSAETTTEYDSYNNPLTSTTLLKEDNTTVQTTVTTIAYKPGATTLPYLLGIPASKNQSVTANNDTMTTEELYTYASNLLTVIKKKGTDTPYITETNTYTTYGSISRKVITATGITRTTSYAYDPSKRFITKTTDARGVITNYSYNPNNGVLDSETDHFGNTISYLYDPWFKKTTTTDYLGKTNTQAYSRQNKKTLITSTGELDEGSYSEELYDDLGRKIRTGIKDIQDAMSFKEYQYDIYDRNFSVSEPYRNSPTQWNSTQYDIYGRPITATDFIGKTISVVYDKLTTTTTDSSTGNTKASTKNAMGNVVKMVETPAGGNPQTVNYSYYANGNLKETDYSGTKTTITQDGWGRKTSLTDSSAGLYSYTYTDIGEILTETTPNGTTTYTYDPRGNVTKKVITSLNNNTNNNTVYTFDTTTRLLIKSVFTDVADANKKITTIYTYDLQGRLKTTTETTGYGAVFTKTLTYDAWGRADIETSTASLAGKTSTTNTQNTYKNGFAYQITDAQSTNPKILWETSEVNARGQLTKAKLGNNIEINNLYDSFGYITKTKHDLLTNNILEFDTDFNPQRGNLNWRKNSLFPGTYYEEGESYSYIPTENFGYDSQDRLISYPDAQGNTVNQTYKVDGRIDANTLGTYNYDNNEKKYQNTSISLEPEDASYYANREGIFSDSMEGSGWLIYEPEVFSYDTSEKHIGNSSLRINNPTSSEKVIHSEIWTKIDNTVATSYTYSAWVYSDAPQAELFLMMKTDTETGYTSLVDSKFTNVTNQWVHIEGTFLVPANIKKLNLRLDNNGQGNVWFDDVLIRKTANVPLSNLQVPLKEPYRDRQLVIDYNTFKSPVNISEAGVDKLSFVYNSNNDRSVMFYGSLQVDKLQRPNRKYYSADGSMEIKQNIATGAIEFVTYIGGDGYSAPVVVKSDGVTQSFLYLHRDYQGSIIAITNDAGTVVEKRQFDAWGAIVKVQDGAGNNLNGLTILDRGYTGHEHLQSVGIINMNGRLYDPKLHRFLQPDNYVQDPSNSQNYNRYGYVLNNPLKYTDPSGEFFWVAIIIGAVVGAYIGGSQANDNWNPTKWDWSSGNTWAAIGIGAVIGGIGGEIVGAGLAGQPAFGLFNVKLGTMISVPGFGTFGIVKTGENLQTEYTNPQGQTYNQNIVTVPVVKPKTDTNGSENISPAQQAQIKARENAQLNSYDSDNAFHLGQYLPNFKADIGFDFLTFKGLHYGIPEFESSWMEDAAFTPGPFVVYPTGGSSDPFFNTHEGGHVLQFALMGVYYYPLIALPSLLHVNDPNTNNHYHEKTANQLWYWWSGESYYRNPIYTRKKL